LRIKNRSGPVGQFAAGGGGEAGIKQEFNLVPKRTLDAQRQRSHGAVCQFPGNNLSQGLLAPKGGVIGFDQLTLLEVEEGRLAIGIGDGQHAIAQGQAILANDFLQ